MILFRRIFFAAVLAGLAAGLVMAAVQQWRVVPLILQAEAYENAEPAVHDHAHADAAATAAPAVHEHDEDAWTPQDGVERTAYTVLADVLAALGFALMLAAASVLLGTPVTATNGVIWGLCGFLVFQLAPSFGLAPELPGMPAADLGARQVWWWGTALCTVGGLYAIARWRNWGAIGAAMVLIALPHLIGAPAAPEEASAVPAHLASEFAANTLSTSALFWLILGPAYGWLVTRFARAENRLPQGALA